MARAIEILVNEAMKIERNAALGAQPYERTDERRGYANAQYLRNTASPKRSKLASARSSCKCLRHVMSSSIPKALNGASAAKEPSN